MGNTYPPAPAKAKGGNVLEIHQFLKDPTAVSRRVQQLADLRLIADVMLSGTISTDSGAVLIETPAENDTSGDPQEVSPGGEYPLVSTGEGDAETIAVLKRGFDAEITDESISRRKIDPVEEAFAAMLARMTKSIDSLALSAASSAITQTHAASAKWYEDSNKALRDVLLARAKLTKLEVGLVPDLLILDDETGAYLASDEKISKMLVRDTNAPIYTGYLGSLANIRILTTSHMPGTGSALLLDSTRLGGMADENLHSPGYSTAPGSKIQVKTMRDDERDKYRLRVRRMTVPAILEARAGIEITGVTD